MIRLFNRGVRIDAVKKEYLKIGAFLYKVILEEPINNNKTTSGII